MKWSEGSDAREEPALNPGAAAVRNAHGAFAIFVTLFAVFVFFHQAQWSYWKITRWHTVTSAAAVLTILMPNRAWPFAMLVGSILCTLFVELPWVSNHWLFAGCLMLTAAGAGVYHLVKHRRLDPGRWYLTFAAPMRVQLIIVYFFTVFHKLNADFLDPARSCGADHYHRLVKVLPFLPTGDWADYCAIFGTLIVETAIFVLLAIPRTRLAGIISAMVFHYTLAINGFPNFSALAFAMMFLFAPVDFPATLARRWRETVTPLWDRRVPPVLWRAGWWVCLGLALAAVGVILYLSLRARPMPIDFVREPWRFGRNKLSLLMHTFWQFYGVAVLLMLWWGIWGTTRRPTPHALKMPSAWLWAFPALIFLNAICPYLGLKTETSFAMFSNLRTEMHEENHLLVPKTLYLTNHQTDVVSLKHSSDFILNRVAKLGHQVSAWEVRSYVCRKVAAGQGNFSVTYEHNGAVRTVADAGADPYLSRDVPWWQRKLLFYRTVRLGDANTCDH